MAKRRQRRETERQVVVDPKSPIPSGIRGAKHRALLADTPDAAPNIAPEHGGVVGPDYIGSWNPDAVVVGGVVTDYDPNQATNGLLATPSFTVVEQVERMTASGQLVIDLVVETSDIPGATNYEFRTTKL
jgi:hypothetical protein